MIRFALIPVALCDYGNANTTPVTKVAETLGNLLQNAREESELDQQNYQKFYRWCQQTFDVRKQALDRYRTSEQDLRSKLAVQLAVNKQLKAVTMQLQQESAEAKQAMQQAALLRQQEHGDYIKEQKNLAGMLQMLNRAVEALSTSTSRQALASVAHSVQQLAAKSNLVSDAQRDQLSLFVQRTQNSNGDDAINGAASVSQVLKELINQFQSTMFNASIEEKQADEQFVQLIGLKRQSFMEYVTSKDAKDAILAEGLQRTTQYQRTLQDAEAAVQGVENYLKSIQSLCAHKSNQWAGRTQVRQDVMATTQSVINQLGATQEVVHQVPQRVTPLDQEQASNSFSLVGSGQTSGAEQQNGVFIFRNANDDDALARDAPSFLQISAGLDMQVPPSLKSQAGNTKFAPSAVHDATTASDVEPHAALLQTNLATPAAPTSPAVPADFNTPQGQKTSAYSAVRKMVDDMYVQLQTQNDDEERHNRWCRNEISKNAATQKDKDARVQRLSTKIDNERRMAQELKHDLELLSKEITAVNEELQSLQNLKIAERANYIKFAKKHQMASHIVRQAISILERVTFPSQHRDEGQISTSEKGFDSARFLATPGRRTAPMAMVDYLSQLLTLYDNLRTNSDKAENQSVIDFKQYVNMHKNMVAVLTQTKNCKQSLHLQVMTELDNDREDSTALASQTGSVHAYVEHLRQACKDILEHYSERRARRERNLRALQQASEEINNDDSVEVHRTLIASQATNNEAAQLLDRSAQITSTAAPLGTSMSPSWSTVSQTAAPEGAQLQDHSVHIIGAGAQLGTSMSPAWSTVAQTTNNDAAQVQDHSAYITDAGVPRNTFMSPPWSTATHSVLPNTVASFHAADSQGVSEKNSHEVPSSADVLRDLRSLQDMSDAAHSLEVSTDGLNMLPAMQ